MKKVIIILFTLSSKMGFTQSVKPFQLSLVQGLSTGGKEVVDGNYHFSFNVLSGTVNSIKGVEIGCLYNQNNGDMTGFQSSGILNITKGTVAGYQTAGISNITGNVTGVQNAGISNHAQNVNGVQMAGILNMANLLKGFQIGLINVANEVEKGGGIGLINLYKKGSYREVEFSTADYQNIAINYRSGTKAFYTIISAGYNLKPSSLFVSGIGLGSARELKGGFYLKPELILYNYYQKDLTFNENTSSTHLRLGLMKKINKVGISLYPSINYANIAQNLEGNLAKISSIKHIKQTKNGQWGFGLALGIALLKIK
jgi:hypothetical protein